MFISHHYARRRDRQQYAVGVLYAFAYLKTAHHSQYIAVRLVGYVYAVLAYREAVSVLIHFRQKFRLARIVHLIVRRIFALCVFSYNYQPPVIGQIKFLHVAGLFILIFQPDIFRVAHIVYAEAAIFVYGVFLVYYFGQIKVVCDSKPVTHSHHTYHHRAQICSLFRVTPVLSQFSHKKSVAEKFKLYLLSLPLI